MANYMSEVAKMLGVEIGEEFKCSNGHMYKFTNTGIVAIYDYPVPEEMLNEDIYINVLYSLLNGILNILPNPWRPDNDEFFHIVSYDGKILTKYWDDNSTIFRTYYKIGNCYRTREEAEANRDKWILFYSSDEVLEVLT